MKTLVIPELEKIAAQGISKKPWTDDEEAILRQYNGRVSRVDIAKYLGRSVPSVTNKAQYLGLRYGEAKR